ncbi:Gigasin-6 [Hypsizygus marmoreus]|uniref:Gigasin-6 n=1 Tax=Hypsizygus marmoreus TaxID=39966 RepID=A0A369JWW5_HYPMA|nr:Gigasin-6 [Hypsizygus marmoreus]
MFLRRLPSRLPLCLLYASVGMFQLALSQATLSPILNDETGAFINQVLTEWGSPGGAGIAVVRRDAQGTWNVETKGYGIATANGSKITENSLFGIGSNSKLFDVFATGLLINNATISPRLSWDSKIASIIPGWHLRDSTATKDATIFDLMSHRTGLPRHDPSLRLSDDVPSMIKKLQSQRPSAEFREVYQYNNLMYIVLSYLPPLLLPAKTPFARYVKEHIFNPLGMASTTYAYDRANKSGQLADGMARRGFNVTENPFGGIPAAIPFWWPADEDGNASSGPGGVISSAVDMATWLQTLLLGGVKPETNQSVIPANVVQRAATGITVVAGAAQFPELSPLVYGAGQELGTYRGHEIIEHGGSVPGYNSVIARLPFNNLGVAVLTNDNEYGGVISEIIRYRLLDVSLGLEPVDWNSRYRAIVSSPRPPAAQRPQNASLPIVNFTMLAGTYDNAGYGGFELCLIYPKNPVASTTCKSLASNVSAILPGAVKPNLPTLLGKYDSPDLGYIRLTHYNGNIFNVSGLSSYPTNNASEPFWTYGDSDLRTGITAEIGVDRGRIGFGLRGAWGAGAGIPSPQGMTARDRGEVWFQKV